jgi:RND superfamily putative drug exporter
MALAVLIGMLVAITLVPALLAILGRSHCGRRPVRRTEIRPQWIPVHREAPADGPSVDHALVRGARAAVVSGGTRRRRLPAAPHQPGRLVRRSAAGGPSGPVAATQAQIGFADGILSPTELLVQATT